MSSRAVTVTCWYAFPICLCACYAMSGTDLAYAAKNTLAMRCLVLPYPICLRGSYAMSGTHLQRMVHSRMLTCYWTSRSGTRGPALRPRYCLCPCMVLRTRYAASGTETHRVRCAGGPVD
eukprot:3941737-Rhodomonas_salina.3